MKTANVTTTPNTTVDSKNDMIQDTDIASLKIINNSTDDLKSEIEKDFIKAQKTIIGGQDIVVINLAGISSNNNNINSNKLKCNLTQTPSSTTTTTTISSSTTPSPSIINTPLTPKSILFSSDEEYRTASEGGRRDSIDWSPSPVSQSPTITTQLQQQLNISSTTSSSPSSRTKDRIRSRSNSNSSLHLNKRSRSSPPNSRRSTIDSIISDDIGLILRPNNMIHSNSSVELQEINNVEIDEEEEEHENDCDDCEDDDDDDSLIVVDKSLEMRMFNSEKEMTQLRDEAEERESRMTGLLSTLEKTEIELTARIRETEKARDGLAIQLSENKIHAQEYIERLTMELNDSRTVVRSLEDKLGRGIEENELLYKKLREIESSSPSSICSLNRTKMKRMDSLSDLTNLNDIDPYCLERDTLAEEYGELKSRFEKAVNEIKAMKKELKDTQNQYDTLEISHASLRQDYERRKVEDESQLEMMAARIQDLTLKYSAAERQVRTLKSKLAKSEKRRSLSLKGRDALSLPKEFEVKVNELETKIDSIDTPTHSPTPTPSVHPARLSNSEERSLKRTSARLRRKSLDNGASPESMSILLRLNTLEKRVEYASNNSVQTNSVNGSNGGDDNNNSSPRFSEHLMERLRCLENVVIASKDRIEQSLQQLQSLKSSRTRRSVSPITDKKDSLRYVERCLLEASKILRDSCDSCIVSEKNIIPETNPIKLSLIQLEIQLNTKLNDLLKERRILREHNQMTPKKDLELLAERIAYESVCFGKLRAAIQRADNPIEFGEKQTRSEIAETTQLISLLRAKLSGKSTVKTNTSVDLLASVLARRLVLTARRTGNGNGGKLPELAPMIVNNNNGNNCKQMDELLRQQNELNLVTMRFKNNAMETLASGLAAETLNYISSNDVVQGAAQEAWRQAQESVNAELVQSEIAHIMMRCAQRYESTITPSFGYTLTHQERCSFENFSDAVQDALRKEMDIAITQLTQCYEESITKMKRGQWRLHLEQERKASEGRQLLNEFADIIAHKAVIDARINILRGDYVSKEPQQLIASKETYFNVTTLQKYENLFAELVADLEIINPNEIIAEADFNFMFKYFTTEFTTNKTEVMEISKSLETLEQTILLLQSTFYPNTNISSQSVANVDGLKGISLKTNELQSRVQLLIESAQLLQLPCDQCEKMQKQLNDSANQHDNELEDLRKIHEDHIEVVTNELEEQRLKVLELERDRDETINRIHQERYENETHLEELQRLNEKLNEYEKLCHLKEMETTDLVESLEEERHKSTLFVKSIDELSSKCKKYSEEYLEMKRERDRIHEQIEKERERIRKLEKHLEFLESEHLQQLEHLQSYRHPCIVDDADEETLRERYQAEIEQLRVSHFIS